MTAWERAAHRLADARRRHPLAVMPGHVLSPMDAQQTVSISRDVIASCEPKVHSPRR
ncbi:hypothetical protein ABLG96_15505 [Nakamurella sp. A5-74]|uniref:Uncharacterized protein n=1 Tax=Nakamurella sp. A5-74 TaxID=3158264 RepID=A0AAU8DK83_9ACTN